MELLLLGSVEIRHSHALVEAGPMRQRSVLAALAVDARRPVLTETLIDRVWGDAAPQRARHTLQVYIGRIRQVLATACLSVERPIKVVRRSGGYLLDINPEHVDAYQFRRLGEKARDQRSQDAERAALLRAALRLWRGPPLAGIATDWAVKVREGWERQRLDMVMQWAQTESRLGNTSAVIEPLTELMMDYPLVEPLVGTLMRALVADGRGAQALQCYAATRARLADELGSDPSSDLQQLHRAILRGDLERQTRVARNVPFRHVPAQLPLAAPGFIGRASAIAQLDQLLATRDGDTPVSIAVLSGTAGVGKTTLAVHWAHRMADELPDGQLYVNLRGFDPRGPMTPTEAIRGFIDALNVSPQRIPAGFEALIGLYRTLLAGRRMMIVLDNARDSEQVRPLLPGAPGCLVLVTSRHRLSGLVAVEGAHEVAVDVLSADESRQLLTRRLGTQRVMSEPHAVDELVERCAGLPIALAIVAARAAARPALSLATLGAELCGTRGLSGFSAGDDLAADVRAVFSWSYKTLGAESARLFRLLGLHPGRDIAFDTAASLIGSSGPPARALLDEMTRASLLVESSPGHFTLHDLLRSYAGELAQAEETTAERREAISRMLDHFLHTATAAALLLDPHRQRIATAEPQPGTSITELSDHDEALGWFVANHASLLAAADLAAYSTLDTHAWQMAWAMTNFLDRQGFWHEQATTQQWALRAAERLGERVGEAHAHRGLGRAHARLGDYDDAHHHLVRALDLFQALGDHAIEAHTHLDCAWVFARQRELQKALDHAERALVLYRRVGHPGRADALNAVGWYLAKLGDPRAAIFYCEEANALHRRIGNPHGEANAWDSLGYAHVQLGDHQQATACYQNAVDLLHKEGDRFNEAGALVSLGDTHRASGNSDAARVAWSAALDILVEMGNPAADDVRMKLDQA